MEGVLDFLENEKSSFIHTDLDDTQNSFSRRTPGRRSSVINKHTASTLRTSKGVARPEFSELKSTVKQLQKDALQLREKDIRSSTDFDFLSSQVVALRKAFGTFADVMLDELDGVRAELILGLKDSEGKLARGIVELSNRIDRLELKCGCNTKDIRAVRTITNDTSENLRNMSREVHELHNNIGKTVVDVEAKVNNQQLLFEQMNSSITRLETMCTEQMNDVRSKLSMYIQSLEIQLAEVLQRFDSRTRESENKLQRINKLYHNMLDNVNHLNVDIGKVQRQQRLIQNSVAKNGNA
eukprot:g3375.t1